MTMFSNRLKTLVDQGIADGRWPSQAGAARELGYTVGRFNHWCTGYAEPGTEELSRLADLLHTHPNYLLGWSEEPRPIYTESIERISVVEKELRQIRQILGRHSAA